MSRTIKLLTLCIALATAAIDAAAQTCDDAWAAYNDFKKKNRMEPDQYTLTIYGAQVRAACGKDALPAPPGADTPHRPIVIRKAPDRHKSQDAPKSFAKP